MEILNTTKKQLLYYKSLTDQAIAQLNPGELFDIQKEGTNSIAIIMKHISGNMLSRWTNIFSEDGEKEWRNRDQEFEDNFDGNKELLLEYWEKGWDQLLETLDMLTEEDLGRIIYIRNQGCTVTDAILRQLCHYSYHVGQIVHIAKFIKGVSFESLSIPIGKSREFNKDKFSSEKKITHFADERILHGKGKEKN